MTLQMNYTKLERKKNSGRGKEHQNEKTAKKLEKNRSLDNFFFKSLLGAQKKTPKNLIFSENRENYEF